MKEEYLFLREAIEKVIEREDKYFLGTFALLGFGNFFNITYLNIIFLILILYISVFMILKLIECRTQVFYISAYMEVFLENEETGIYYESRMQKMREIFWNKEEGVTYSGIYNRFSSFGYYIKNFIFGILATIIFFRICINLMPIDIKSDTVYLLIVASIGYILNIIYSVMLTNDRFLKQRYYAKWKIIKRNEKKIQ